MKTRLIMVALFCSGVTGTGPRAWAADADSETFFNEQVFPLLRDNCFECHGEKKQKGHLRLDSYAGLEAGGELGAVVLPGEPDKSLLIEAVRYGNPQLQMPPKKKLTGEQVAVLEKWVKLGTPWPGAEKSAAPAAAPKKRGMVITDEHRAYWAFQKVTRPNLPAVKQGSWVKRPLDAFVLARLEEAGLQPNPPASKRELIRRVYYDLLGLPPTPDEVEAFVQDTDPAAYEKLLDQLLQSPQYGEKWGRHWLDLVRFAETNGYERDGTKPYAWRYRDYVIQSFANDKSYDLFIREQIAGDTFSPADGQAVIATGFYRLGVWDDEPADAKQALYDGYDDIITVVSQGILGITINCARCHDHKIDPIPQSDYYRMLAFFRDIYPYGGGDAVALGRQVSERHAFTDLNELLRSPEDRARIQSLQDRKVEAIAEMVVVENEAIKTMPAEDQRASEGNDRPHVVAKLDPYFTESQRAEYAALKQELKTLEEQIKAVPKDLALSVNNSSLQPPVVHVMLRGSPHAEGDVVEPGFPAVLGFDDPVIPAPPPGARSSGRRAALADWLTSPDNPLTSRVITNRVWQHHFGRGIVRSSSDFGGLGDKPTHPELLDWLAAELMSGGWKLKAFHKLIMTSNTYLMSSVDNPAALAKDPNNDLFWRFDMRRLTAEEIRDSILAVNGTLNRQMGGPSIYTEIPDAVLATASMPQNAWGKSPPDQQRRRSVYIFTKRSLVEPVLGTFDLADTDSPCPVRFTTTVPTQSLTLLNSKFSSDQAAHFAARLKMEAGESEEARVELAMRLALQRAPTREEVDRAVQLLADWREFDGLSPEKSLEYFCLMVLNLNEFIYLD